jgi:hypothetical protein
LPAGKGREKRKKEREREREREEGGTPRLAVREQQDNCGI